MSCRTMCRSCREISCLTQKWSSAGLIRSSTENTWRETRMTLINSSTSHEVREVRCCLLCPNTGQETSERHSERSFLPIPVIVKLIFNINQVEMSKQPKKVRSIFFYLKIFFCPLSSSAPPSAFLVKRVDQKANNKRWSTEYPQAC